MKHIRAAERGIEAFKRDADPSKGIDTAASGSRNGRRRTRCAGLHSENAFEEADVILPDGGRGHYVRSPKSGPSWWQTNLQMVAAQR